MVGVQSNVHEIRRAQQKYGKKNLGSTAKVAPAPSGPKPPVLIGDGEEVANTWSSQTALRKAMEKGMEAEEGPSELKRAGMQRSVSSPRAFSCPLLSSRHLVSLVSSPGTPSGWNSRRGSSGRLGWPGRISRSRTAGL